MPSDYTDFIVIFHDAGDRVFRRKHYRNQGNIGKTLWLDKGQTYHQMLDRAYRIRWVPWYLEEASWKHPFAFLREVIRKKKVGLLLYQEPEAHTSEPQEPIHISRIAQPSGRILHTNEPPEGGLVDKISPFILKMIVDSSSKYRKAYKSYAFGLKQKLMSNWVLLLILGIVGLVMFLYFTGYIRV